MPASATRQRAAFTLLEVMAAVAVLGLVYVVIARSAIEGLMWEGEAQRRLRASLLADRVLAELEGGLRAGGAPQLGRSELDEDGFAVLVEVTPFDPLALGLAALFEALPEGHALAPRERPGGTPPALLAPPSRGGAPALVSVYVRVAWTEGISEQAVTRTTFFFDPLAAAPELGALAPPAGGEDRS
jgi:prepilin-type N-terminal cleavage/methylation domain-containing protein